MRMKMSTRWIQDYSPKCRRTFSIPYIDKAGKDSVFPLARIDCHPMQLVGSLVATKFDRIMKVIRKRFIWKEAKALRESAFSAAIVSVVTQSAWIIDRFLGVSRVFSKKKIADHLVRESVRRLDDIQRFVYSQAYNQAYWLTSRSERPRDKSRGHRHMAPPDLTFEDPLVPCACKRFDCHYASLFIRDLCSFDLVEVCELDSPDYF